MTWCFEAVPLKVLSALSAGGLIVLMSSGCGHGVTECTTNAVSSVTAYIESDSVSSVDELTVEYRRMDQGEDYSSCGAGWQEEGVIGIYEFSCGYEVSGLIELRATTSDGKSGEAEVTVTKDECHVRTETVTIVVN